MLNINRVASIGFTDHEVNHCFSIYHKETKKKWINFCLYAEKWFEIKHVTHDFFSSANRGEKYWLITSELVNRRTQKVLFTHVVYTYNLHNFLVWAVPLLNKVEVEFYPSYN